MTVLGVVALGLATGCRANRVATPVVDPRSDAAGPGPTGECPTSPPEGLTPVGGECACDIECLTGRCEAGVCCTGAACSALRPLGSACTKPADCHSGFCADRVCCNVACTGACVACDLATRRGECSPVPAGAEDKHGVCRRDPADSCGQTGSCNGQGGCAKYAAGSQCRPPSCESMGRVIPASQCDGNGTCVHAEGIACDPSICEGGACRGGCDSDTQCLAPSRCTNGSCGQKGLGQACASGNECASTFCVDGVCCESDCAGRCRFCASPQSPGRCATVGAGAMDPRAARGERDQARTCLDEGPTSCGANGRCDGQGGCQRYADGTVCREPSCDSASNTAIAAGTCAGGACTLPGARTCAPFQGCVGNQCRNSCATDPQCVAGNRCLAGDCGKRANGSLCSQDNDCASGTCAQGRCCASACNQLCRSCGLPGQEGTCANVGAGGADPTGVCLNDACSNGCDGAGGCRREAPGTTCGSATCELNRLTTRTCSAEGACVTSSQTCGLGLCLGGRCVL
jgi:hypothetical protein